jgi:hypothetical protein
MRNSLLQFYRFPDELYTLQAPDNASVGEGYFSFHGTTLFGRISGRVPSATSTSVLANAKDKVQIKAGKCYLPFDPDQVSKNLREERYIANGSANGVGNNKKDLVRWGYYLVRPLLGVAVRKHLQRISLRGAEDISFPHWPVDRTVDRMFEQLLLLQMKALGVQRMPFIWFWPDRSKGCAMMTHDVETRRGLDFCSYLMDLNDSYQVKSSFQIIPVQRYKASSELLQEIKRRNFEVNVHDWNHDGRLYLERTEFLRRAALINEAAETFGADGFRSGALYRNADWYDAYNFSYDMSVPNVGHFDPQRGGCCSIMPYFIGSILELPVTTIQDYSLFQIRGDYSIDLWKRQIMFILENHGLASFIVHPDYIIERKARSTYAQLLEYLKELRSSQNMWIARPKEINTWWRQRNEMKLIQTPRGWQVEGEGKERASIAYAASNGDEITYSFDPQDAAPERHLDEAQRANSASSLKGLC